MRRKDKEITDKNLALEILKKASFVRFGLSCANRIDIAIGIASEYFEDGFALANNLRCDNASFSASICLGIKSGNGICSCTTKYLSTYGTGHFKNNRFVIDNISAKCSGLIKDEIPQILAQTKKETITNTEASDVDIAKIQDAALGIWDEKNNETYIAIVNHAEMDGCYYFHSALAGRKIDLLQNGAKTVFECDEICADTLKYRVTPAQTSLVEENAEKCAAMAAIIKKYTERNYTFQPQMLAKTVIVKIKI